MFVRRQGGRFEEDFMPFLPSDLAGRPSADFSPQAIFRNKQILRPFDNIFYTI